jgi:hypothetical protein
MRNFCHSDTAPGTVAKDLMPFMSRHEAVAWLKSIVSA